jgi:hypothetical protein
MWCCVLFWSLAGVAVWAEEINILFVGDADAPANLGARQGLAEANAQGEFLGIRYRLVSGAAGEAVEPAPVAVIAAVNTTRLRHLAKQFSELPVLNTTIKETFLREDCWSNLFHIGPSAAMLEDAERQWQRKAPGSTATARAWHPTFRKYAAAQLNARFRERFDSDMDDDAWSGWAAMKLLSDTIARQPTLSGGLLVEELKTNLAFDGQKGSDMSFRETGQLRQPLLLVADDRIVGEAPVRGVVNTTNLDSLGVPFCPK